MSTDDKIQLGPFYYTVKMRSGDFVLLSWIENEVERELWVNVSKFIFTKAA
jgi:hypothetical protein